MVYCKSSLKPASIFKYPEGNRDKNAIGAAIFYHMLATKAIALYYI